MCADCETLRAVIVDLQASEEELSFQVKALAYKLAQSAKAELALIAKLAARDEESPDKVEIRELLEFARDALGKNKRWSIEPGGDRWALAEKTLKWVTKAYVEKDRKPAEARALAFDACKTALIGLGGNPYVGKQGRSPVPYPGAKRFNDLEHAFSKTSRFGTCWELATGLSFTDLDPDAEANDAKWAVAFQGVARDVARRDRKMDREGQRAMVLRIGDPVDVVLEAASARGFEWRQVSPTQWELQCPVHDDRSPSCQLGEGSDGRALLACLACGADAGAVAGALGLSLADLFVRDPSWRPNRAAA